MNDDIKSLTEALETIGAYEPSVSDLLNFLASEDGPLVFKDQKAYSPVFTGAVKFIARKDLDLQSIYGLELEDRQRFGSAFKTLAQNLLEIPGVVPREDLNLSFNQKGLELDSAISPELDSVIRMQSYLASLARELNSELAFRVYVSWGDYNVIITAPPTKRKAEDQKYRDYLLASDFKDFNPYI
jgi:hypothetical protein